MPKSRRRPQAADSARLPVVPEDFEAVTEADRRFFLRYPQRSYRVRHTSRAEIDQGARAGSAFEAPYAKFRWFTAIRQVAPGCRLRVYLQAPALCETDIPEALAADIYHRFEGQSARDTTILMMDALRKAGAL
jgi:hypothetical protein